MQQALRRSTIVGVSQRMMLLKDERAEAGGKKLVDKPGFCRRKPGGGRIRQRELQAAGPLESLGQAGGQLKDIYSPVEKSAAGQTCEAPVAPSPCPPTPHSVIGKEQLMGAWILGCLLH